MAAALGETDGYDLNGNETSISLGGLYTLVYDDEDRLLSFTAPGGISDTFTYNGLGLRVGKTDHSGTYSYLCDGTSPGSPVLSDGHAVYTAGLSERRGGVSSYYDFDQIGNLWTVNTGTGDTQTSYQDMTAFGTLTAGSPATSPYQFSGKSGCQTDSDSGLVLMGHRYFDTRTGRFINQDPAHSGGNWYAYAGNNPINKTDPSGLWCPTPDNISPNGAGRSDGDWAMEHFSMMESQADQFMGGLWASKIAQDQAAAAQATSSAMVTAQASSSAGQLKLAIEWLLFPGSVENDSDYAIPVLFDRFHGPNKIFYMLWVPPHTYTDNEDIDFVWVGNDPSARGGFDWRHILSLTTTYIYDSGNGVGMSGMYRGGLYKGYPFGVSPIPYPGNPRTEGIIKPTQVINPIGVGPIIM